MDSSVDIFRCLWEVLKSRDASLFPGQPRQPQRLAQDSPISSDLHSQPKKVRWWFETPRVTTDVLLRKRKLVSESARVEERRSRSLLLYVEFTTMSCFVRPFLKKPPTVAGALGMPAGLIGRQKFEIK